MAAQRNRLHAVRRSKADRSNFGAGWKRQLSRMRPWWLTRPRTEPRLEHRGRRSARPGDSDPAGGHNGRRQIASLASHGVGGIAGVRVILLTQEAQGFRADGQSIDRRRAEVGTAWDNLVTVGRSRLASAIRDERLELLAIDSATAIECHVQMRDRLSRKIKKRIGGHR